MIQWNDKIVFDMQEENQLIQYELDILVGFVLEILKEQKEDYDEKIFDAMVARLASKTDPSWWFENQEWLQRGMDSKKFQAVYKDLGGTLTFLQTGERRRINIDTLSQIAWNLNQIDRATRKMKECRSPEKRAKIMEWKAEAEGELTEVLQLLRRDTGSIQGNYNVARSLMEERQIAYKHILARWHAGEVVHNALLPKPPKRRGVRG